MATSTHAPPRAVLPALLLLGMLTLPTSGQTLQQPIDPHLAPEPVDLPRTLPKATLATQGMVSSAHPLASRIGVQVLRDGGNAIDALVAVQMVLTVVEPQSSGIGGGCFIVYHENKTKAIHCVDGREEVPAAARREDFLDARGAVSADPLTGPAASGVPGTVAAMWLAHGRWGRLPIKRLLEPAIRLAEEGSGVTPRLRSAIAANQKRFLRFPSSHAAFLHADGSLPEIGEVRRQPALGKTLRLLAEQGPRVFYEGEIAQDIVKAVQESPVRPGRMSLKDLRAYRAVFREPVRFSYRGHEIVGMPPPSSGTLTLGLSLGILEGTDVSKHPPGSVDEVDLLARAGATAFADRNAYLGDQDWSPTLDMRGLLTPGRLRERAEAARTLQPGRQATPGAVPGTAQRSQSSSSSHPLDTGATWEGENTTHFSIVDADRNIVACTTTIEHGMGCGLVVPGRGFLLNNELTDFDLAKKTGPNALDVERRPRSTMIGPSGEHGGKRPRSSMTPVIVFKDGQPILTAGSPGGSRIIGIVAQILVNVIDHRMDAQQAINAPRLSSQNGPLFLEALYPDRKGLGDALSRRGWKVQGSRSEDEAWGGAHAIRLRPDGKLEGGADPRREGAVRGY